jgi:hypothetical protein
LRAQEFKATYNDSARNVAGLTAPVDVEQVTAGRAGLDTPGL